MKSIIFLVLSVTIIFPLAAQTMATTDDGQRVQLNGNRTWQYAPETLDAELHPVVANLVGTETVDMYTRHSKAEVQYPFGYLDLVFRFENTTDVTERTICIRRSAMPSALPALIHFRSSWVPRYMTSIFFRQASLPSA
jgi:hypothetical protein